MNLNLSRTAVLAATALVASLFAQAAYAGQGASYWTALDKNAAPVEAKAAAMSAACPGMQDVAVTTLTPAWANGRGPLTEVQVGTEKVCHMCPVTTATTTTAWTNGRGPTTQTDSTAVGATHHCSTGCMTPTVASN